MTCPSTLKKLICTIVVCASAHIVPAWCQSTDFSRPTPITEVPLTGEHDGSRDVAHFYTFEAGPGSILVTFDGHTTKYSSNAQTKLWDANRNPIGELGLTISTEPSSVTKRFNLAKRQRIILETDVHQDSTMGVMSYSVNISGAVQLARPASAGDTAETDAARSMAPAGHRSGRLHLEMKDGTVRDFDMTAIRRIVVEQ